MLGGLRRERVKELHHQVGDAIWKGVVVKTDGNNPRLPGEALDYVPAPLKCGGSGTGIVEPGGVLRQLDRAAWPLSN